MSQYQTILENKMAAWHFVSKQVIGGIGSGAFKWLWRPYLL